MSADLTALTDIEVTERMAEYLAMAQRKAPMPAHLTTTEVWARWYELRDERNRRSEPVSQPLEETTMVVRIGSTDYTSSAAPDEELCMSENEDGFRCTLLPHQAGDHVAGDGNVVVAIWSQGRRIGGPSCPAHRQHTLLVDVSPHKSHQSAQTGDWV